MDAEADRAKELSDQNLLNAQVAAKMGCSRARVTELLQRFVGADCLQASKWIEEALGVTTADNKTGEFFTTAEEEQHVQQ